MAQESTLRRLIVEIVGDSKGMTKASKEAEAGLAGFEKKIGKVSSALAGAFAGGAMVAFAKVATDAALQDDRAQERLAKTLKNVTSATNDQVASVEKSIAKMQDQYHVLDDELRPAFETLVRGTKNVGQAQGLLQLALDVSAGSGRSLQDVSVALVKSLGGQSRGLRDLGIQVKDTAGKTLTFKDIQAQLTAMFTGQAALAANSEEGRLKALGVQYENLKESVGRALLPVLLQLAQVATTLFGWFNHLDAGTQQFVVRLIAFAGAAYGAVKLFGALKTAMTGMSAATLGVTGVVGLAVVAMQLWSSEKAKGTKITNDFVAALKAEHDGQVGAINDAILATLSGKDTAKMLAQLGVTTADAARFVRGDMVPAVDAAMDSFKGVTIDGRLASLMLKDLRHRFADARPEAERLASAHDALGASTSGLIGPLGKVADATGDVTGMTSEAIEKLREWARNQAISARDSELWASRTKAAFDDAFGHIDKIVDIDHALQGVKDKEDAYTQSVAKGSKATALQRKTAFDEWEQSIKDLTKAQADLLPAIAAIEDPAQKAQAEAHEMVRRWTELQKTTQKGSPLWQALQDLIDQLNGVAGNYAAHIDVTASGISLGGSQRSNPLDDLFGGKAPQRTKPKKRRAAGGPVAAGESYLVGEQGVEVLHMGAGSGSVTPNHALGGRSGSPVFNINVDARGNSNGNLIGQQIVKELHQWVRTNGKLVGLTA